MNADLLIEFCRSVRESTIKRLELLPEGYENWKISPNALSFAELAKHIIDLDNWLFEKIKNPNTKSIETETAMIQYCSREGFKDLINDLKRILQEKINLISMLEESELESKIYDDAYDSEVSLAYLILRRNIDHEIHHRGQIAAYLRVLKDKKIL